MLTVNCLAVKPTAAGATKIGDPRQERKKPKWRSNFPRLAGASSQGHPPPTAAPQAPVLGDGQRRQRQRFGYGERLTSEIWAAQFENQLEVGS
jgi:hypothetical protein